MGARSRRKGKSFEGAIAQDMRRVFDHPDLVNRLESTTGVKARAEHKALLKESRVRDRKSVV
jgi:hypothetical protein